MKRIKKTCTNLPSGPEIIYNEPVVFARLEDDDFHDDEEKQQLDKYEKKKKATITNNNGEPGSLSNNDPVSIITGTETNEESSRNTNTNINMIHGDNVNNTNLGQSAPANYVTAAEGGDNNNVTLVEAYAVDEVEVHAVPAKTNLLNICIIAATVIAGSILAISLLISVSSNPSESSIISKFTSNPSFRPTFNPSLNPSLSKTSGQISITSLYPSLFPSFRPTSNPTLTPSLSPTSNPTSISSLHPSHFPSSSPTMNPSSSLSFNPTFNPSLSPTSRLSLNPSLFPSFSPTTNPTSGLSYQQQYYEQNGGCRLNESGVDDGSPDSLGDDLVHQDNDFYNFHADISPKDCKELCNEADWCQGFEHGATHNRCELWKQTIGYIKAGSSGYTCSIKINL